MSIAFELVFIVVLIIVNGLLALAEISIVSARKTRLKQLSIEGDARAKAALELAENPNDFLATVQVGITLVGVLAGAFSGATLAEQLAVWIGRITVLAPYREALGIGIVVLVITYFSILLGELVPKRLGLNNAERIASAAAGPMGWLSRASLPIVRLLSWSSNAVFRLFKIRVIGGSPVTEEEIKVLIEQGAQAGVFEEAEQDMVSAVFRLTDRSVGSLMTPRTEITWLDLEDPYEINQQKILDSVFDRFPVARGSLDNLIGIVQAKNLLAASLVHKTLDFEKMAVTPILVPESMPVLEVLELFRKERSHMALVFDEYGGVQGLVTTNDILSAIVGNLPQVGEEATSSLVRREDGSWLVDGMYAIDELKDVFRFKELPHEDRADFETLGGFMMSFLGRIPKPSDHFEWNGYRFEIMDMDGFRVDKVLIAPLSPEEKQA